MNHEEMILRWVGIHLPLCPELLRVIGGFVGRHPLAELIATLPCMENDIGYNTVYRYDNGYEPTFVRHLSINHVLKYPSYDRNVCLLRIYMEYHSYGLKMREWLELHDM